MRCVDVNVLIYAHRVEVPRHPEYRGWLEQARRDRQRLGIIDVVGSAFIRITTEPQDLSGAYPARGRHRFHR